MPAICIHYDSQSAIGRAQNDMYNGKEDIPIWPKPVPTICIHCDSQFAIGRCITVSLDIYVVDIIPLGNCSQMGLFLLII